MTEMTINTKDRLAMMGYTEEEIAEIMEELI
jgi:hypothetical protein